MHLVNAQVNYVDISQKIDKAVELALSMIGILYVVIIVTRFFNFPVRIKLNPILYILQGSEGTNVMDGVTLEAQKHLCKCLLVHVGHLLS